MTESIKDEVKRQFGAHAANYVTSSVHARGSDLPLLPGIAGLNTAQTVLDVATAAGHTAFALAPHAREVIGADLTPEMLAEARRQAEARGIGNVTFVEADAEHLPFPAASFDLVTCRIAAHHFPDVAAFCREAARVLKPGGMLLVVDNVVPEDDGLDQFINRLEKLRDPSHFRAWKLSQWAGFFREAGFTFTVNHRFATRMEIEPWIARLGVAGEAADQVRAGFAQAPPSAREAFAITPTSFILHKAIMTGRKPA